MGRKINVLDVGGRAAYWQNIDTSHIAKIVLMNLDDTLFPYTTLFRSRKSVV